MSPKQKRYFRRRNNAIGLVKAWSSLRTHLASAVKAKRKHEERFHSGCVLDYVVIMLPLATELHELNKIDCKKKFKPRKDKI